MQAIILIGIQASGKSTFYKENFFDTHMRINLDLLKTRYREKVFLDICIKTQRRFVVDNTNATPDERLRYIIPAKEAGYEISGYYFEPEIKGSLKRNKERGGKVNVPAGGIFGTLKKLQKPSYTEGFDKLYKISRDADNKFIISDWEE